jgi:1-acyl-sn-glycerol-3-phosphate acyltransferase
VLTTVLCLCAVFKFLAPTERSRLWVRSRLAGLAEFWISINNALLSLYRQPEWDVELPAGMDYQGCYLISSNHQSWVDILVLQHCFNRRLPFMRFFIKSQLFWVPFLGIAWWALDMPFMRRDSKERLARNPALKGRDLDNARRACEKFRGMPVSIMNFPEGTRFSPGKRDRNKVPYRNLLFPRIGGVGQVLYALSDQLDALMDVTIVYPRSEQAPTFWQLASGQIPKIVVRAESRRIPPELLGRNFRTDREFRGELNQWINAIWVEKDDLIDRLNSESGSDQARHERDADAEKE